MSAGQIRGASPDDVEGAGQASSTPTGRADKAQIVPTDELRRLQQRSDAKGLGRLAGHLIALAASAALYALALSHAGWPVQLLTAVAYGFTLVTMFAAMHESVHRTAFKSRELNDGVGWLAGLLSFYNSTFYRHYHSFHHRFTQIPGQDPELEDPKPTSVATYLVELSGITWWIGKLRTHARLALGRTEGFPYLNDKNAAPVVRSVRLQLATYGAAIVASLALGYPYFVVYWLVPVALAQPLLRAILLAEHTGCSQSDDMLANTRTTLTVFPVRFLMWDMPYHAEHHRYPALPFFVLAETHRRLAPHLVHVAKDGYVAMNLALIRSFSARTGPAAP